MAAATLMGGANPSVSIFDDSDAIGQGEFERGTGYVEFKSISFKSHLRFISIDLQETQQQEM